MRHLISPLDFTVEETYEVLDFADRIATNPKSLCTCSRRQTACNTFLRAKYQNEAFF